MTHANLYRHVKHRELVATSSAHSLGMNLPQRLGGRLWAPMLLLAVMAFPAASVLAALRARWLDSPGVEAAANAAALGQYVPAAMFLGFAAVLAAIVFSIARILGTLRVAGGDVQELAHRRVLIPTMPATAKWMLLLMAVAMMILLAAVGAHAYLGGMIRGAVLAGDAAAMERIQVWSIWLEGARRFGVALYLVSITLGLATIARVLRIQSIRLRELPDEAPHA